MSASRSVLRAVSRPVRSLAVSVLFPAVSLIVPFRPFRPFVTVTPLLVSPMSLLSLPYVHRLLTVFPTPRTVLLLSHHLSDDVPTFALSHISTFVLQARTPVGSFGGVLKDVPATQLGSTAVRGAIDRAGLRPDQIEDGYIGNVIASNMGQAPARQVILGAGCPSTTEATTINKVCSIVPSFGDGGIL
jgi:hypothetical protein